jgi:O-antigen/teichoic acid export membrane protein
MSVSPSMATAPASPGASATPVDVASLLSKARAWLGRGSTALCDQALFAGGNFVLNVTLAASLPAAEFGAFVFAFTMFTIAAGFHNAVVLESATVLRTTLYDTQPRSYCRAQLILHLGVMGVLGGLLALAGFGLVESGAHVTIGRALTGVAWASPFILMHWLGRRFLYVLRRPTTALCGSAIYFTIIVAMTWLARLSGMLSAFSGFAILGIASAGSATFLMARAGVFGRTETGAHRLSLVDLARERWAYGRWLIGAVCIESAIAPGLTLATTLLLGLSAVGVLRAMQVFAVPAAQTVAAISTLVLPALARDYTRGHLGPLRDKTNSVLMAVVAGAVAFEVALAVLHGPLEHLVYRGKFADYAFLIPIVGAAALLDGTAATYAMLLSAVQRPRLHLVSVAWTVPVTLIGGFLCISLWGITGAALTSVMTALVSVGIRRHLARRWLRTPAPISAP